MHDADRFELRFGSYRTSRFRYGKVVQDACRGDVKIVGLKEAKKLRSPERANLRYDLRPDAVGLVGFRNWRLFACLGCDLSTAGRNLRDILHVGFLTARAT